MNTRDWLIVAGVAGVGYLLYKKVTAIPQALTATGEAIGGSIFDWLNPNVGSDTMLLVHFDDGSQHYIDTANIDTQGNFTYNSQQYTMYNDAAGLHHAQIVIS